MMILLIAALVLTAVAVTGTLIGVLRDGYGWRARRDCTPERPRW